MLSYRLAFDRPWFLALLALLPVLWWFSYRTLSGLGRVRRMLALVLRTVVLTLLVLSLAEVQLVRTNEKLTVIYLLDQSLSVPEDQRRAWIEYVNSSVRAHRNAERRDRAGVIVFGRDAAVEMPPVDETLPIPLATESLLDPEYTDLAGGMKLALALFPQDAAKRIVLVTDGNENLGDALTQAKALIEAGVSIDVAPISIESRGEVAVEKLAVSSDVRRGQAFDLRVVLNNSSTGDRKISGKLKITRRSGEREETLAEQPVELGPGKRVLTIREQLEEADFYTYEARFIPDRPQDDAVPQNNRATAFTHVRGKGHVLLIEDWERKGEFDYLVSRLRADNLEVTVQTSDQLFASLAELQRFDTVLLADVPRTSGEDADRITHFSDEQIEMLVRNTQQMGAGLVMIGGPNSYGAGGWLNTELEKAMPVDFQIKSPKVQGVGALAMIMHASEMAQGNFWQKKIAQEAIKTLGPMDYCGVISWDGTDKWLWTQSGQGMLRVGPNRPNMLSRIDRMTPNDMPAFDPGMALAAAGLAQLKDASFKHMIIISDGDPSDPLPATIAALKKMGVRATTVAVGAHGSVGAPSLQKIATQTGGKYYVVNNPKALPRIYQREARRIARPVVFEDKAGLTPKVKFPHEIIKGLESGIPPITGFVLTTVKDSPLVEVALVSPQPAEQENATILAAWTYGIGRTVVLTTDAGKRWATNWTGWDNYDKLFTQIVRWSMRPVADTGKFTIATELQNGQGRVIITGLDKDDEFLNFLNMTGTVVGPNQKPLDVTIHQAAPGRYVGEFDVKEAGSYFVTINPGPGLAPLRTGLNVPYSDEFRDRETNEPLLEAIAALKPEGGDAGQLIRPIGAMETLEKLVERYNPFRFDLPRATASEDIWNALLLIAACLLFWDIFNRRVHVSLAWVPPLVARVRDKLLRRAEEATVVETMERLRSRKAAVDESLEQRRAATRFEPTPEAPPPPPQALAEATGLPPPPQAKPAGPAKPGMTPEKKEESYTERLLKAKKKVWDERKDE